jgi:hypothetical protein
MTFLLHIALVINALYSTKHSTQRTATKKLVLQFFRFLPLARVNPPKMAKMINRSVCSLVVSHLSIGTLLPHT